MDSKSLADRLKALGVKLGPGNLAPANLETTNYSYPIETVVSGWDHPTIFGPAFVHLEDYQQPYHHGSHDLFACPRLDILAKWGKAQGLHSTDLSSIVFLDTETSGLAGGTGTYAFIIGIGWFTDSGFRVEQLFLRDPSQEAAFLTALIEKLSQFNVVVTFNGKSFDIPLLVTRFNMNRAMNPFVEFEHLDLLHLARRIWRDRLPSRSLGELEKSILNFHRTEEEVPGYLIPEYYFNYLRSSDARPLAGVLYHNAVDIVSLAALFKYIASTLDEPLKCDVPSLDRVAIARLYDDLGFFDTAASLYELGLAQGLPEDFFLKTLQRFALSCRKQERWDLAKAIWIKAAQHNDFTAYIELAKFYEHHEKDPIEALDWVQEGLSAVSTSSAPLYLKQTVTEDLERRMARLLRKMTMSTSADKLEA